VTSLIEIFLPLLPFPFKFLSHAATPATAASLAGVNPSLPHSPFRSIRISPESAFLPLKWSRGGRASALALALLDEREREREEIGGRS